MSLYDGLGIDKGVGGGDTKTDVSGWSQSYKLLHSQLQAKKASLPPSKSRFRQTGAGLPPVVDLKRSGDELRFNQHTGKMERISSSIFVPTPPTPPHPPHPPHPVPFIADPAPTLIGLNDEYDPLRPNDYEEIMKRRREIKEREREEDKKQQMEETRERDRDSRRKRPRDRGGYDEDRNEKELDRVRRKKEEDEAADYERGPKRGAGAAIAPPSSLMEDVVTEMAPEDIIMPERQRTPGASLGLAGSIASKIMAKYGYKEGQGLGKSEQGMSTALQVEKTSKRGGKIIHEKDIPIKVETPPETKQFTNVNLLKNPSKVILLLNMVGPGEVDEDLQPETAEECSKYGKVIKCVIFELPEVSDEEAVRIFVEFERVESAIKAVVDMNGRYFGGRTVRACFYNLDKFRRFNLADPVD